MARNYNCNRIFPHSSANRLCGHSGNIFDFRDFSCNFSICRRFSVRNLKKYFPNELLKFRSLRIYSRNVSRIFSRKIYVEPSLRLFYRARFFMSLVAQHFSFRLSLKSKTRNLRFVRCEYYNSNRRLVFKNIFHRFIQFSKPLPEVSLYFSAHNLSYRESHLPRPPKDKDLRRCNKGYISSDISQKVFCRFFGGDTPS